MDPTQLYVLWASIAAKFSHDDLFRFREALPVCLCIVRLVE
jgi:hypothetical protein